MKKLKSEWTSVQINKEFIKAAMRKAESDSNIPEGSIKTFGFVNSLLAKYAAGKLKEIK